MDCPDFALIASNTDPRWLVFMFLPLDHLVRLAAQAGWDPPVPYSYGNGADDIQSPIPVPNLGRAHLGGPAWQPYPPWQASPRHVVHMCAYLCIVQRYGPTFFCIP